MSRGTSGSSAASRAESYSPQRRTALLLSGTGTAGVYHAGVLRALHEAGVKIDVVAARGVGVVGALFMAVDGAPRLWDARGFWRAPGVKSLYPWSGRLRILAWAAGAAVGLVVVPILAAALGLVVFPIDFVVSLTGASGARVLIDRYLDVMQRAFAPGALPTWLPRLAALVLGAAAVAALVGQWLGSGARTLRGGFWWRLLPAPLSTASAVARCWVSIWDLLRGAAPLRQPPAVELGRRYVERLTDNMGQPGYRELLVAAHDVDAGRDVVFALVAEARRRDLVRRPTTREAETRRAEVVDVSGVDRDHFADAVAACLTIPGATEPHVVEFSPESFWRGERHRLCDRPATVSRLIDELLLLDVEQVVLVTATAELPGPHALAAPRLDGRGRLGEYLQSSEAAAVRDAARAGARGGLRVYMIRPAHNPIGPFDFAGGFDNRSDRRQPLAELMNRGYEDGHQQFVEPVVGASGERVG
jgi:predicted acylesterase/phospholipase RssA